MKNLLILIFAFAFCAPAFSQTVTNSLSFDYRIKTSGFDTLIVSPIELTFEGRSVRITIDGKTIVRKVRRIERFGIVERFVLACPESGKYVLTCGDFIEIDEFEKAESEGIFVRLDKINYYFGSGRPN